MSRKDKDKKVDGISATQGSSRVKPTEAVSEVDRVKGATAVSGVSRVKGVGKAQAVRAITLENAPKILSEIAEEADLLVKQGILSSATRPIWEDAVRKTIQ